MHNQPQQPLDELHRFRKHLTFLLSEEAIVKATVEAIYSREIEADRLLELGDIVGSASETSTANNLQNALEACRITLEEESEIVCVSVADTHWLTFHTAEWAWQNNDGKWPWEHE